VYLVAIEHFELTNDRTSSKRLTQNDFDIYLCIYFLLISSYCSPHKTKLLSLNFKRTNGCNNCSYGFVDLSTDKSVDRIEIF
jgi:hypothetical protein